MGSVYTRQILVYILIFFSVTFTSASMESGYYFLIPFLEGVGAEVGTLGGLVMGTCYGVSFLLRLLVPFAERLFGREKVIRAGFLCHGPRRNIRLHIFTSIVYMPNTHPAGHQRDGKRNMGLPCDIRRRDNSGVRRSLLQPEGLYGFIAARRVRGENGRTPSLIPTHTCIAA